MGDSSGLEKDIESALRSHGVPSGEAQNVLDKEKSSYSQFSAATEEVEAGHFLDIFRRHSTSHFCPRAPCAGAGFHVMCGLGLGEGVCREISQCPRGREV